MCSSDLHHQLVVQLVQAGGFHVQPLVIAHNAVGLLVFAQARLGLLQLVAGFFGALVKKAA